MPIKHIGQQCKEHTTDTTTKPVCQTTWLTVCEPSVVAN